MPSMAGGKIERKRAELRVGRRAFDKALAMRGATEIPALGNPGALDLLEAVDDYISSLPKSDEIRRARESISQYERAHSDVTAIFQPAFGVSDGWLDQLFTDAAAIERDEA